MADLGENLRTAIAGSTAMLAVFSGAAAPHAVEQGTYPQEPTLPRIWYGRANENEDLDLGGTGGLVESRWDLEVISDDLDEAQDIAAVVKRYLNGRSGTLGTQTVQGIFVEDHNDDYLPRGVSDESGFYVAALSVSVWHAST